jgi:hypothetical protein
VRSVKEECRSRLILFGEASLRHALTPYVEHFPHERHHQGQGNMLSFPAVSQGSERRGPMPCRERLGGSCNTTPVRPYTFFDYTGLEPFPTPIEKIHAQLWLISPFY